MTRFPLIRRNVQRDIDDELRFHLDARIEELVAEGATPDAARAQALAEFGDVNDVRSGLGEIDRRVARRRSRGEFFDVLRQDVVYAARSLRRAPAMSLAIIVTLALGLGVNAAMFSLLDVLFLRPPAVVAKPHEIRRVWSYIKFSNGPRFWSGFDYTRYAALQQSLGNSTEMAIYRGPAELALGRGENLPKVHVASASESYFRVLGIKPALGRFYTPDEDRLDGAAPVVVVSHAFWSRELDADASAVGREIVLAGNPYTVIGVAPPRFSGVDLDAVDIWRPFAPRTIRNAKGTPWYRDPGFNGFQILLRPHADARLGELEQRATVALRQPGIGFRQDTSTVAKLGSIIVARGPGVISGEMQVAERLGGVAIIVLVIACANVINLLLARAVRRRREIAVRLALGISRARLVRLLVTESVLLSAVAGVAALGAAWWGGALLRKLLMPTVVWAEDPLHWRVLAFALVAALVAGAVAGLIPALQSRATDLTNALKAGVREGGGHRSRLRSLLVVSQAALSVVLLVGAALFVRSLDNVKSLDIGYAVDRLAFASVRFAGADSPERERETSNRLLQLEQRLAAIPGVERVAFTSVRPKWGIQFVDGYYPDADTVARRKPAPIFNAVSPGFFEATGTKLKRGRVFARGESQPVVMINEAMAHALWPQQEPLGKCIRFEKPDAPCATIVGITQTALLDDVKEAPSPHMYVPLENSPISSAVVREVVLRVAPATMTGALASIGTLLRGEFSGATVEMNTMAAAMEPDYRPWRLGATLFSLFGGLAALVAAVGIYSSVSYGVSQRTHEFGVRAALGADAASILRHVVARGVGMVAVGVVAGIVLAIAAGRLVASLLYGVSAGDPLAITLAALSIMSVAAVASLVPAWRAARVDPVAALRAD